MGKQQKQNIDIEKFYTLAHSKIEKIEQGRRRFGRKNAPWFNPIDFWWVDENKTSQILAFFLNPSESHEQGDRYLRHFIKKFGLDFFTYNRSDKLQVQCNVPTDDGRCIDIVIHKNLFELAIGIENRIHMNVQEQQGELDHYSKYLSNRTSDDYCLIYLTPVMKNVSQNSLSLEERRELARSKKFKHLTYEEHLIDCIAEFGAITESVRVKSFLNDFEKTMRKRYMGEKDLEAKKAIVDLIGKSQKNLEISFLVSSSLPEVKRKLKDRFKLQVEDLADKLKLDIKKESDRVWLKPKKWKNHYFSYAYDNGHIFYGMTQDKVEINKNMFHGVLNHLNGHMKGDFQFSEWWPAHKYMYRNIDKSPDFWKAIKNGKAKEEMKVFIELMIEEYETDDFVG